MISKKGDCHLVTESCAKWHGGIDNIVTLRGNEMEAGAYFIGIEGLQTTIYSFTVEVNNKKNETII